MLPQVLSPEHRFPQLRDTVYFRNARRMASALLGVDEAVLHGWGHMILKPAHRGHETPWHQDEAYWPADKAYTAVGAWMPLDDASVESGCLHFVPGSHRGPVLSHHHIGHDPRCTGSRPTQPDTTERGRGADPGGRGDLPPPADDPLRRTEHDRPAAPRVRERVPARAGRG